MTWLGWIVLGVVALVNVAMFVRGVLLIKRKWRTLESMRRGR